MLDSSALLPETGFGSDGDDAYAERPCRAAPDVMREGQRLVASREIAPDSRPPAMSVIEKAPDGYPDAVVPRAARRLGREASRAESVLIISSSWWAFPAQMAMVFARRGLAVHAVCPRGHPLRRTASVGRCFSYSGSRPLQSLKRAIAAITPSVVVPCDDRTVGHLLSLLREDGGNDQMLADLIRRSLGAAGGHATALRRSEVVSIARAAGVAAPEMVRIAGLDNLHDALSRFGLPAVLKVDGSWGGFGVAVVHSVAEAEAAYRVLATPLRAIVVLKRLLVDRESFSIFQWLKGAKPVVNVQRFVYGRPATSAVACWNGEVLACSTVEVLQTRSPFGASTVVRRINSPAMVRAATTVVNALGLSGLCGFDFLIESGSDAAHLLECNPRATPLCHLNLGDGADPLAALLERSFGISPEPTQASVENAAIAFFPQCWLSDPGAADLHSAYHDVPWSDPGLVRELVRQPWPERGFLARLTRFGRRTPHGQLWRATIDRVVVGDQPIRAAANDQG